MNLLYLLFATYLLVLAPAAWGAPASVGETTASAPSSGWTIEENVHDCGPVSIFITDKAIRCNTPMGNCIFLAPKYDLYFFNEYTRRITHMDRNVWLGELASIRQNQLKMFKSKFRLSEWSHSRAEVLSGQPTQCYSITTTELGGKATTTHYAWVATNPELLTAAKVINPLLHNLGKMWPPVEGMPMQMVARVNIEGKTHVANEWLISKIESGPIVASTFVVPQNYQSVPDWMQVMSSVDLDEMMGMYNGSKRDRKTSKPGTGFGY